MIPATVTFYGVVKAIHVFAVVFAFGVTFSYPLVLPWLRAKHPDVLPTYHEMQGRLGRMMVTPGMVLILLSGIYLASDGDFWKESWVTIPFVILIILFGMGGAFFSPRERKLTETAKRDLAGGGTLGPEYDQQSKALTIAGSIAGALIVIAVFIMVAKPF